MANNPQFVTYSLEQRTMVDYDGLIYPIVKMYDCDGDLTDDPKECRAFIAGEGSYWVSCAVGVDDGKPQPN